MKITLYLCYITLFLSVLLVLSCNRGAGNEKNEFLKVRIATLKGPAGVSMVKMAEELKNVSGKIQYEFIFKAEPNLIKPLMFQKEIEFAVMPSTTAALMYNMGSGYLLAGISAWGTLYLAGTGTGIGGIADLRGRRIYMMAKGMTPDIVFRYILQKNGLDPEKDVILDYSFPSHIELANAMKAERIELGVVSEPFMSLVMSQNSRINILMELTNEWDRLNHHEVPLAQTAFLVREDFARQYPEIVEEVCNHYREGIDWMNDHPKEGGQLVVQYELLPDTIVAAAVIPRCRMEYKSIREIREPVFRYLKVFYDTNPDIVGGHLPDESFYYPKQAD